MRVIHRAAFNATSAQRSQLAQLGAQILDCPNTSLPGDLDPPFIRVEIDETNPMWAVVVRLFNEWDVAPILTRTEFTPYELDTARWLHMTAWDNGFILPIEDMQFIDITYDMSHACRCGVGKIQKAPIRIKMEPKWGRKGIMSLNGAYDEFFVPPAVWETVFKPFGIGCRPVANRHGKLLQTVVQLVFEERVDVVTKGMGINETCEKCGTPKYRGTERGPFAPLVQEPSGPIARTRQAFGCGWTTYSVIVSQDLRQAIIAHNLRGANFVPVESALPALIA